MKVTFLVELLSLDGTPVYEGNCRTLEEVTQFVKWSMAIHDPAEISAVRTTTVATVPVAMAAV